MSEYIYILISPAFQGLVKIGRTNRTPLERANELSRATGVPASFIVAYEEEVSDSTAAEAAIHAFLSQQGVRPNGNREFFEISLSLAVKVVSTICASYKLTSENENTEFTSSDLRIEDCSNAAADYFDQAMSSLYGDDSVFQDVHKASELFELSLKLGHQPAVLYLTDIYYWGLAGKKDPAKAIDLLKTIASSYNPAYERLWLIYSGGYKFLHNEDWLSDNSLINSGNALLALRKFLDAESDLDKKLEIIKKYLLFFEKSNFDPQWGGYHCVQTYLDDCAAQCRKKFLFIKDLRISKNDLPHNFSLSEYILALDIFSLMPLGERHYFFKFIFTDIEVDDFDFAFARLPVFRVDQLRAHVQRYLIQ